MDNKPPLSRFQLLKQDGKLVLTDDLHPKSFYIDFLVGKQAYRQKKSAPRQENLLKAIGWQSKAPPSVIDATAGLGRDAVLMASVGCDVIALEEAPEVYALLQDALTRLKAEKSDFKIQLFHKETTSFLKQLNNTPDVIYLDPMFPERQKSALVKRELQLLQALVGESQSTTDLFQAALSAAKKRVVVKRPLLADYLENTKPDAQYTGKTVRFDVYLRGLT